MHIPDGYLSPATCGVMYGAAAPFWYVAATRVRKALTGRTVPVLALFAAFSFVLMMFNVPLPGGTTGHAVGGTLLAIVLGPWAAVIGISMVLGIQALFFGDGGLMSFGANCFNMAIVLPLVGYFIYKVISSNSEATSTRRLVAAVIGSYIGIVVAAFFAGVELGIQPTLFHNAAGVPLYAPYGLSKALPSHGRRASSCRGPCRSFGDGPGIRFPAANPFQPYQSGRAGKERGEDLAPLGGSGPGGPGHPDWPPCLGYSLG